MALALAGAIVLLVAEAGSASPGAITAAGGHLDRTLAGLGLGIDEVRISGHRHVADRDVFAAMGVGERRSLLLLDATAARARVEALAWVETARITRVLPSRLDVTIVERRPVALWRDGDRHALIDAGGRVLARVTPDAAPDLPRVVGPGAPQAVAGLLAALGLHPGIAGRITLAEHVGERRWTLVAPGGSRIHLPESGLEAALQRLADLDVAHDVVAGPARIVDLRHEGHVAVRDLAPPSAPPARAAGARLRSRG